jgi:DNA (cytosine-5)-methyltransferase 1
MTTSAISQKIARLGAGGRPRLLDLFAGCGGLSLGFQAAGFDVRAAVEFESDAARSHGINFHDGAAEQCRARDITATHPEDLAEELDLGPVGTAVDVIVGGPPCQAFARVGRSKLREIDEHPEAFKHDPRARLYREYLRYVEAFRPLAVLMENVPDVLNHGGQNIAEETCEVLEDKGYVCGYTLLNAAYYGVPQMRERMFLIGYRRELASRVVFPKPTHWVDLPPGYEGSRSVALKLLSDREDLFGQAHSYVEPPEAGRGLARAVTAAQAIGDLPPIYAREEVKGGRLRRGARRFDKPVAYGRNSNLSAYVRMMRTWPGFEAPEALCDHVIRHLPRDYELFARLNPEEKWQFCPRKLLKNKVS